MCPPSDAPPAQTFPMTLCSKARGSSRQRVSEDRGRSSSERRPSRSESFTDLIIAFDLANDPSAPHPAPPHIFRRAHSRVLVSGCDRRPGGVPGGDQGKLPLVMVACFPIPIPTPPHPPFVRGARAPKTTHSPPLQLPPAYFQSSLVHFGPAP